MNDADPMKNKEAFNQRKSVTNQNDDQKST